MRASTKLTAPLLSLVALAVPTAATAATGGVAPSSAVVPAPVVPPGAARLVHGIAYPPPDAPPAGVRARRAGAPGARPRAPAPAPPPAGRTRDPRRQQA